MLFWGIYYWQSWRAQFGTGRRIKHSFKFPVNPLFIMYQNDDANISTKYFLLYPLWPVSISKPLSTQLKQWNIFCIVTKYLLCPHSNLWNRLYSLILFPWNVTNIARCYHVGAFSYEQKSNSLIAANCNDDSSNDDIGGLSDASQWRHIQLPSDFILPGRERERS